MSESHDGQKPLRSVEAALEAEAILAQRPAGMPSLSMIQTELARMGFPESDAADVFDRWLANGFRGKAGPVRNWKAALRTRARNGWLPSQRSGPGAGFAPPTAEELIRYAVPKKWPTSYARWCYQFFVANNWRYYGKPITSTEQWQALMATELMDRAPK